MRQKSNLEKFNVDWHITGKCDSYNISYYQICLALIIYKLWNMGINCSYSIKKLRIPHKELIETQLQTYSDYILGLEFPRSWLRLPLWRCRLLPCKMYNLSIEATIWNPVGYCSPCIFFLCSSFYPIRLRCADEDQLARNTCLRLCCYRLVLRFVPFFHIINYVYNYIICKLLLINKIMEIQWNTYIINLQDSVVMAN